MIAFSKLLSFCFSAASAVSGSGVTSKSVVYPIEVVANLTQVFHVSQFDPSAFKIVTLSKAFNTFDMLSLELESESESSDES